MAWKGTNIYLVGLPGAGKSSVGKALAEQLERHNYRFVDLDEEVERDAGRSIDEIFRYQGEASFRELETAALARIARPSAGLLVVATGGGTPVSFTNRAIMRGSGVTVWLDASAAQAARNILAAPDSATRRPSYQVQNAAALRTLLSGVLKLRRPFYAESALRIPISWTQGVDATPAAIASGIRRTLIEQRTALLPRPTFETAVARTGLLAQSGAIGHYPILVGRGITASVLPDAIRSLGAKRIAVVTDTNVERHHGLWMSELLRKALPSAVAIRELVLPAGEAIKSEAHLLALLDFFRESELNRRESVVVSFGGGVVSDLAGLAASLYQRGLPLIHVPTTVLAQADAAIGAKTGIDFAQRKNLVGSFYAPRAVIADSEFLRTLPARERHAGLAEMFKYALIGSRPMWREIESRLPALIQGRPTELASIMALSINEKVRCVDADEFERKSGVRELLNFGHTFGHALESAAGFEGILHGEAVLLGMRAAAWLSRELGYLPRSTQLSIDRTLARIPIAPSVHVSPAQVTEAMRSDKKRQGGARLILLRAIGEAFITNVPDSDLARAVRYMLKLT